VYHSSLPNNVAFLSKNKKASPHTDESVCGDAFAFIRRLVAIGPIGLNYTPLWDLLCTKTNLAFISHARADTAN
jgi:hypothetical protein